MSGFTKKLPFDERLVLIFSFRPRSFLPRKQLLADVDEPALDLFCCNCFNAFLLTVLARLVELAPATKQIVSLELLVVVHVSPLLVLVSLLLLLLQVLQVNDELVLLLALVDE